MIQPVRSISIVEFIQTFLALRFHASDSVAFKAKSSINFPERLGRRLEDPRLVLRPEMLHHHLTMTALLERCLDQTPFFIPRDSVTSFFASGNH